MKKSKIQKAIDLHQNGFEDKAANMYKSILISDKGNVDALSGLGYIEASRKNFLKAIDYFNNAVSKVKNNFVIFFNKGICEFEINKFRDSINSFKTAIRLNPNFPEAYNSCGNSYRSLNDYNSAIENFNKAIKLNSSFIEAYINRSYCLKDLNQFDAAYSDLITAYRINPNFNFLLSDLIRIKKDLCDFENFEDYEKGLIDQIKNDALTRPFTSMIVLDDPELQQLSAKTYVNYFNFKSNKVTGNQNFNKKIKIGYFSADFYNHATMHVMANIFEHHNKSHFETYAFSFGKKITDDWHQKAVSSFDVFVDVHEWSDHKIAEYCKDVNLDIAIDLKGFTKDSRMGIFTNNPAPITINFLGSPCTLGTNIHDYIIADKHVIPKNFQSFYSEKILYLPNSYYPAMSLNKKNNKFSKSTFSLPEDKFIFCSFNNNYKITPDIFEVWCKLLANNSNSILWILCSNNTARQNLLKYSSKFNINKDRIIFADHLSRDDHLMRLSLADLFLDTYPCGGHTSASDSLRAEVPVISLYGKSFASRVARSLLIELDLEFLSVDSLDGYFKLALDLSKNNIEYKKTKIKLKKMISSSTLYKPKLFAENLDTLFKKIVNNENS